MPQLTDKGFSAPTKNKSLTLFVIVVIATFLLRISLSCLGHNFDFESYELITNILDKCQNVYGVTDRYNYSPIWMWILYGIKQLSPSNFRVLLSIFVSLIDIGIASTLLARGNKKAAYFILLSPVCITISGFHNQFDNLAIFIALLAVRFAETRNNYEENGLGGLTLKEVFITSVILGLSVATKHILFFFPLWLLFRKDITLAKKAMLLSIPYSIFLFSFVPYLAAYNGIMNNVFLYKPHLNAPFYNLFFPAGIIGILDTHQSSYRCLFYILLVASGYLARRRPFIEAVAWYLLLIVLFSSSLYTHYMVIPMLFLAYYNSPYWFWYNGFGLLFFLFHHDQYNLVNHVPANWQRTADFIELYGYYPLIICLLLAIMQVIFPEKMLPKSWLPKRVTTTI